MKCNKEDFNFIWKDTTKEGILNQFYYEHIELIDLQKRIDKAIFFITTTFDNYLVDDYIKTNLLEILKEGEE